MKRWKEIWIRKIRNRHDRMGRRILAGSLIITLLVGNGEWVTTFAATGVLTMDNIEIYGFAELEEDVREQVVPLGTQLEELVLPDTLEASAVVLDGEKGEVGDAGIATVSELDTPEEIEHPESGIATPSISATPSEYPGGDTVAEESERKRVSISGVTWECEPEYEGHTEGIYVFTAVLPEDYIPLDHVELPYLTVTVTGDAAVALTGLLESLPDPFAYLSSGTADESLIREKQLAQAREAVDAYLETGEELPENFEELLERLEWLEHIRDTERDCEDLDCPVHYPPIIQEKMAEDEIPELLTMEDLAEELDLFAMEPGEAVSLLMADWSLSASPAGASLAGNTVSHPQTLMVTADNEDNNHTGQPDDDIDIMMSPRYAAHPIEITFQIDELPTQSAYLAVKAYDVDEDSGETDYVYLNDDIYLPMDQKNSYKEVYNDSTIGYLSGTNSTWNTTVLEIPIDKLRLGKNVISITIASRWVVKVDWMQLILDGGAKDENMEEFALQLKDSVTENSQVTVNALATIRQKGKKPYYTEYTLLQTATGNALDACFGQVTDTSVSEDVGLTMPLDSESGVYRITGVIKDENEQIAAMDSLDFYFKQGIGLSPEISHTIMPDTYTNSNVTISVSGEDIPAMGIEQVQVVSTNPLSVSENGIYEFTIRYRQNGVEKEVKYPVTVSNIDREPPEISYSPIIVDEGEDYETVKRLFDESVSATDDRMLAAEPLSYTIPSDITAAPGEKVIPVTAKDAAGNMIQENCSITVTAKPARLTMGTPEAVPGSRDSYSLKAVLTNTGAKTITETGFVWGVMQNPTLTIHNGTVQTASPVTTKGGTLTATASGLLPGITYYVRAYAKAGENVTYSDAASFGFGIPQYGTFSVSSVSGNTFTITRTGGSDERQTVYYRTVNGSAVGGTHFDHLQGTLVFENGEMEKTVTVPEHAVNAPYNGDEGTRYSNADRIYSLEIYRVEGGGRIDASSRSKTRTMAKNNEYSIDRTVYTDEVSVTNVAETTGTNGQYVADSTGDQGAENYTNIRFLTNRNNTENYHTQSSLSNYYPDNVLRNYLNATASGWYYRYVLKAYEHEDGYEHVYMGKESLENKFYTTGGKEKPVQNLPGQLWACTFLQGEKSTENFYYFPATRTGGNENSGYPLNSSGSCIQYQEKTYVKLGTGDTCYLYFGANGKNTDIWYVDGLTSHALVYDEQEPELLGIAPMAPGIYLPGDPITVSLIFDEIVDSRNSSLDGLQIVTSAGTLTYAGGGDTNVLYFSGNVTTASSLNGANALTVTGISSSSAIRDLCGYEGTDTGFSGGQTNITVDATKPTVTITAKTTGSIPTHSAAIASTNAQQLQYAWSESSDLPSYGWSTVENGETLTASLDSGSEGRAKTWYLHALAVSSNGATAYACQPFSFQNPAITGTAVLSAPSSGGTDVADVWKKEKYLAISHAGQTKPATLTWYCNGEEMESVQITSTSPGNQYLQVTENGIYTAVLTDSYGNVVSSTIEVKKIDRVKPVVAILNGNSTDQSVIYDSLSLVVLPEDETNGSGIGKVEYAWTSEPDISEDSSDWTELIPGASGYVSTYTASEITKTEKYFHVRVTDQAGNVSDILSAGPYMMKAPATAGQIPTLTVTEPSGSWEKSKTLTWEAKKGEAVGSGEIDSVYTPDGTMTGQFAGTCTVTKNGLYAFTVMDEYNNTVSKEVLVTRIDNEGPKLTGLSVSGTGESRTIALTGATDNCTPVYNEQGMVTGYSGSGIKKREYQSDGQGTWTEFTGESFPVTKNGTYTIRLTDILGNVGSEYQVRVEDIDVTKPTVICRFSGTQSRESGWYTSDTVEGILTFTDEAGEEGGKPSGVVSVAYQWVTDNQQIPTGLTEVDPSQVEQGTFSTSRNAEDNGTYYLYYRITDKKGNVTSGFSEKLQKDSVEGSWTLTGPGKGQPVSEGITMTAELTYGPSGGILKAQDTLLATLDPSTGTGTRTIQVTYTRTEPGSSSFRYYSYGRNGSAEGEYSEKEYAVCRVDFDSQSGSAAESQLVWYLPGEDGTFCMVTKPEDPSRTGYTFGGWYTEPACADGTEFNFATGQLTADTTLYAKWTANTYQVTYHLTNPDGTAYTAADGYTSYTYGEGLSLPVPEQEGFRFSGWYDNKNYTGTSYTEIHADAMGNKEYHAYFQDISEPELRAELTYEPASDADGWYGAANQPAIRLTYEDNVAVTGLYVSVDGGDDTSLSLGGTAQYDYDSLEEGEHTYSFRAEDGEGNFSEEVRVTAKLDTEKPEIVQVEYTYQAANLWNWIIGKTDLIIEVSAHDSGSGAAKLIYTRNPEGEEPEIETIAFREGKAEITFSEDFRGTITLTGYDLAGNASDSITLGADGGGILVEDHAPEISFTIEGNAVSENYYEEEPSVSVNVTDDGNGSEQVITGGVARVTYRVGSGTEQAVSADYDGELLSGVNFTIGAGELSKGENQIIVTATDHAGNTASQTVVVKVKKPEKTPEAVIRYRDHALSEMEGDADYRIIYVPEDGAVDTVVCTADGDGIIEIEEAWYGTTVRIVKMGNDNDMTDSEPQSLDIPERPEAPSPGTVSESGEGKKDGCMTNLLANVLYQISQDGGMTWQTLQSDGKGQISGLASGSYLVRVSATDSNFAGKPSGIINLPCSGNLRKDTVVAADAPIQDAILGNNEKELFASDGIFASEEKSEIMDGRDARVWLEITNVDETAVTDADRETMEQAAKEVMENHSELVYFGVDLFKQIDGGEKTRISEPGIYIQVTIRFPEELLNHSSAIVREYRIIRLHEGTATVIDGEFNEQTGEFSFETDKFSTYAIVYRDRAKHSDSGGSSTGNGMAENLSEQKHLIIPNIEEYLQKEELTEAPEYTNTSSQSDGKPGVPVTGDDTNLVFWIILLLLSSVALIGLLVQKRKNARDEEQ